MNLLIALHGKPGSGEDWQPLLDALELDDAWSVWTPTRPVEGASLSDLIATIDLHITEVRPERVVVLAYSWGCWLALQHALIGARAPDGLVLLNPYLVAESPISPVARAVLAVPGLGGWILSRSAPQRAADFVAKSFAPATPEPALASAMIGRLSRGRVWRGAVVATQEHVAAPLPHLGDFLIPTLALVGENDTVASAPIHGPALPRNAEVQQIDGAGHALPWTPHSQVVPALQRWLDARTDAWSSSS